MATSLGLKELLAQLQPLKAKGLRLVLANGAFDVLHVGHVRYLQAAKALGDILVVAVNADASVRRQKGPERPIYPVEERVEMLLALRCIDYVTVFEALTVETIIETIQPDIHAKGSDYTVATVPEASIVQAYGGEVCIVGDPKNHSTTALLQKIKFCS